VAGYLLSNFSRADQAELPTLVADAADAVEAVVKNGLTAAMNKYNVKKKR
jgi:PTH1 family peptidyl-tRNA hydrolase